MLSYVILSRNTGSRINVESTFFAFMEHYNVEFNNYYHPEQHIEVGT